MRIHLLGFCLALILFSPDAVRAAEETSPIATIADLNGKRLGVVAGTVLDIATNRILDLTVFHYYDTNEQLYNALYDGEIDAVIDDEPVVRYRSRTDSRLRALPETLVPDHYGYAMRKDSGELHRQVNIALRRLLDKGVMTSLEARWIDGPETGRILPEAQPVPENAETLRVGVSSISPPFCYRNDAGDVIGLDMELLQLIAGNLGRRLEVTDMDFGLMMPALLTKDVDLIGGCFSITKEREQLVLFTDSYYTGGTGALVLR